MGRSLILRLLGLRLDVGEAGPISTERPRRNYTVLGDDYTDDKTDPEFVSEHEGSGQVVKVDEGEHKSIVLKLSSATPPAP